MNQPSSARLGRPITLFYGLFLKQMNTKQTWDFWQLKISFQNGRVTF